MTSTSNPAVPATLQTSSRARLRAEVLIVLGLTLGQSAVYAAVNLIRRYLAPTPIGQQTTTLNPSYSEEAWVDVLLQTLRIGFALVPVALAIYLLGVHGAGAKLRLGLTRVRPDGTPVAWWKDVVLGAGLAAAIGIPGLALYAAGRAMGQTVRVDTSGLPDAWWAATVLLASAAVAGLVEEVIVVGYLMNRLADLKWSVPAAILASALMRGAYHLYQGWPMALGNVVMGVVFAFVYSRGGRIGPLIAAHWLIDAVAFIGPEFLPQSWLDSINAD